MRNSQQDGSPVRPLAPDWHLSPWEEEDYLMRTVLMVAMVAMVMLLGCDENECGKSSMDSTLGFKQVLANHQFASLYIFQSREGGGAKTQYNMAEMKTQND